MTDKKLSQLSAGTTVIDSDLFYSAHDTGGGTYSQVSYTGLNLKNYIGAGSGNVTAPGTLTNNAPLIGQGTTSLAALAPMTNGQLLIGNTGNPPSEATLTAGSNITITNAAGAITIAATGGGTPAAPVNSIQFNSSSAFGGDGNLTWVAGIGFTDLLHAAFGAVSQVNNATFAPGDPTNASSFGYQSIAVFNEQYKGDFHAGAFANGVNGLVIYPGYTHTGTGAGAWVAGIDFEPVVTSDSTGPMSTFDGLYLNPYNYGSGNITNMDGINVIVEQRGSGGISGCRALNFSTRFRTGSSAVTVVGTTGTCNQYGGTTAALYGGYVAVGMTGGTNSNQVAGMFIDSPTLSGGATTPALTQLLVKDASGVSPSGGPALNVWSTGATSLNRFDGLVRAGTGPGGAPGVIVNEACNAYNHAAFGGL
jgi:hypothetical protein